MGVTARTGCDVQRIEDVEAAVADFGSRYLDRVYTAEEQSTLRTGGAASLAARFAAKEAVLKVLAGHDIGGVDLRTVEIATGDFGRPVVRLTGQAAALADTAGIGSVDVSLSHTGGLAFAVAVAIAQPHDNSAHQSRTCQNDGEI